MTRRKIKGLSLLLTLALLWSGQVTVARAAVSDGDLTNAIDDTAVYLCRTVEDPRVGSVGGEWMILGLVRGSCAVPEGYYQDYATAVEEYVRSRGGKLHNKKYTEYSRVILAISAIGVDARDVGGYDLTCPLGDYDKTVWQGLNGPIWALIALDSRAYPMPVNREAATQATRQMYIDRILTCQLPDGGWSLSGGGASDPDVTGMALQALAKYREQGAVAEATERALTCVSQRQDANGGFSGWGTTSSESVAQMICALCELGISLDDPRFVKNGVTLLDNLMTYYRPGQGFLHTADGAQGDLMATEQGLYALVAVRRARAGQNSLYRMPEIQDPLDGPEDPEGQKHARAAAVGCCELARTLFLLWNGTRLL